MEARHRGPIPRARAGARLLRERLDGVVEAPLAVFSQTLALQCGLSQFFLRPQTLFTSIFGENVEVVARVVHG